MNMVKKRAQRRSGYPQPLGDALYGLLEQMGGVPAKSRLSGLWENWAEIMGPELASLMSNYGNRGDLLILGAGSSLQMQNLQFVAAEALDKANAYLGAAYFTAVRVSLYGAEKKRQKPFGAPAAKTVPGRKRAASGQYLAEMDMASPVARCYARFAASRK